MKKVKKKKLLESITKESDRLDKLLNIEEYPSLKTKSDKILNKKI